MTVYARPGTEGALMSFEARYDNYINGEWVAPTAGKYFENRTPVTGEVFCEVARSDASDIDKALDAAHAAAPAWGKTSAGRARRDPEQDRRPHRGEPRVHRAWPSPGTTASRSARRSTPTSRWPSTTSATSPGRSARRRARCRQIDDDTVAYHFHEPLGVVGQIIPWNFPILMAVWKLAPALAAGNAIVLKPAEQTPVSVLYLMSVIGDLLPPGVLNVVNGFGVEAGKPLASSNRIAKIAFTGETTTGRLIMQYASQNLIPVTLELGGKSPNIFFNDVLAANRRLPGQGAGRLHHVRPQPGRGVHVPVAQR